MGEPPVIAYAVLRSLRDVLELVDRGFHVVLDLVARACPEPRDLDVRWEGSPLDAEPHP